MKELIPAARVMVVGDNAEHASSILDQLRADHPECSAATNPATAVQAFDDFRPEVVVVAFDTLAKAQAYSLRLYRLSQAVHAYHHRNVLLCTESEAPEAYQLCREGAFDDYVTHGAPRDGLRVSMSVLQAARQLKAAPQQGPSNVELISHVKRLSAMQVTLDQHEESIEGKAGAGPTLKSKLAPHFSGLQSLREKVRSIQTLVMLVDDDEFARKLTMRALDGSPYDLTCAQDGTAALALLRRTRPDLILMDVSLPDIDGVTLTQKLKGAPHLADIPVLMLTGDARRQTLDSSMTAGAAGFVVKPFTARGLIEKLDRFLSTAA
jgi:CheY-like chemotaxis protein